MNLRRENDAYAAPPSIFEGITASKGFVDYWNRVAPVGGVDGNRTLFHVLAQDQHNE